MSHYNDDLPEWKPGDFGDSENEEVAGILVIKALAHVLKDDEGIVLHHEGVGYVVYRNSLEETITVIADDDYLNLEHGRLIWMHYEGSKAPEAPFEELMPEEDTRLH